MRFVITCNLPETDAQGRPLKEAGRPVYKLHYFVGRYPINKGGLSLLDWDSDVQHAKVFLSRYAAKKEARLIDNGEPVTVQELK